MDQFDDTYDNYDDVEDDSYEYNELTEKLAEIIDVSKDISKIYKGLIYDNDNKMLLKELRSLKKYEDELYQKLDLDMTKIIVVKSILREFENIYGLSIDNPFGAACNYDIENLWTYRIEDKIADISKGGLDNIIKLINISRDRIPEDDMDDIQRIKIDEAISDDFYRAFIYFLDEEIEECEEGFLKQYLIETKYKLIYITAKLDNEFIEEIKKENKPLFINFGMISDLLLAPKSLTNNIQEEAALPYLDYAIGNVELLKEYGEEKEFQKLFSIYFRAGLALMYNCENYDLLIEDIKSEIMNDDSFSCLEQYVQTNNPDKGKCRYLSLYRPNNY